MATDLVRLIGGPGDQTTFRIDTWPPPALLVYGASPGADEVEPAPAFYTLRFASTLTDGFAGDEALIRCADYDHGGEWSPPGP